MKKVDDLQLEQIQGGAFSWGIAAGIVAAITFIVGVVDGYINPIKCNN